MLLWSGRSLIIHCHLHDATYSLEFLDTIPDTISTKDIIVCTLRNRTARGEWEILISLVKIHWECNLFIK